MSEGDDDELGDMVEVPDGNVLLEVVKPPQRDQQGQHHGQARENRPGHEIWGEDRAVPSR